MALRLGLLAIDVETLRCVLVCCDVCCVVEAGSGGGFKPAMRTPVAGFVVVGVAGGVRGGTAVADVPVSISNSSISL